jgi:CheY-like chemotaxis protein|tara:strand:- start:536 stop:994 length:459 start_codon:yes stop_codon:yes gene_type:complete
LQRVTCRNPVRLYNGWNAAKRNIETTMNHALPKIVLLVEDEPHILSLLSDYLASEGYQVLEADSAPKAFEILATKPQLDLLVTDFRLPGNVSGVMIAEPALKLRPDLKVIFISGYPIEIYESGSPIARSAPVLAKPFALDTLHSQIQALLAS